MINEIKLQPEQLNQSVSEHLMEVHLVERNDIYYSKGRNLAKDIYRQVWSTENLIDGNDYGVVVSYNGEIVGNMNIQFRQDNRPLKSEHFFGKKHWESYFDAPSHNLVEIASLSITSKLSAQERKSVMMLLLLGANVITRGLGIKYWITIQLKTLYRILTKRLHLPFFGNEIITNPQSQVPDDDYWKGSELPQLYYLDLRNIKTVHTFHMFFCYLNITGIKTSFSYRIQPTELDFSSFQKQLIV